MFSSHFSEYGKSRLHYIKAGSGKKVMIFFHGFGQDHSVYLPIVQTLAPHYTLYIFDLYFHGRSEWHDNIPISKGEWQSIFEFFLNENSIDDFSLTGYSLGGKFVFATLHAFPKRCKQIYLIAPDGIALSFWYLLAVYPLRRFFRSLAEHYERFNTVLQLVSRISWVDRSLLRFADFQMGTREKRQRVYLSWVLLRRLSPDKNTIVSSINTFNISATIVIGKFDPVIPPSSIKRFARKLKNVQLEILDAGHTGLLTRAVLQKYLVDLKPPVNL